MIFLDKKLQAWVQHGLLSEEQARAIGRHELDKQTDKSWIIYGIAAIGIAAIAIGVVSVVAANWDKIHPYAKLASYAFWQTVAGALVYWRLPKEGLVREALIGFFALLFFAGIGLTAQVFNIQSNGWSGLLFWCALTLPAVLLTRIRPLPYLWFIVLMVAECIWLYTRIDAHDEPMVIRDLYTFALVSLYFYFAMGTVRHPRLPMPKLLTEAAQSLSFLTLFVGGTILGTIFWYTDLGKEFASLEGALVFNRAKYLPWFCLLLALPPLWKSQPLYHRKVVYSLTVAFILLAGFTTIPLFLQLEEQKVVGTLFSIILWWSLAVGAVYAGWKKIFDLITLLITIRILVIYFEVFGSMMATGVGLIVSGFLILGVAWIWYRFRDRLAKAVRSV